LRQVYASLPACHLPELAHLQAHRFVSVLCQAKHYVYTSNKLDCFL
jgi:hypothetical protein